MRLFRRDDEYREDDPLNAPRGLVNAAWMSLLLWGALFLMGLVLWPAS